MFKAFKVNINFKAINKILDYPSNSYCTLISFTNCGSSQQQIIIVHEKVIGTPKKQNNIWWPTNNGFPSIAPHLVITLKTGIAKVVPLNFLLISVCICFVHRFKASFLYCSPYSYRSFSILKAIAIRKTYQYDLF